jgi:prophage regulatory protein
MKNNKKFLKKNTKFLRLPAVLEQVGFKASTIYEMIKEDRFPAPVHLGPRLTAWVESEVQQWMQDRIDEREKKKA